MQSKRQSKWDRHFCKRFIASQLHTLFLTLLAAGSLSFFAAASTATEPALESKTIGAEEIQRLTLEFARQHLNASASGARIEYRAANMDSRLSLRRCDKTLSFDPQKSNARAGRKLIKVRCEDNKPWAIFVPIHFDYWRTVVTAKRPIQRNDLISASDLELSEQKLGGMENDYLIQTQDAVGLLATRSIEIGKPLSKRSLVQPKWIKRGDEVVIIASSNGVSASMPGLAMADGSEGQQIAVRNRSSKRVIKARVIAPGKVQTIM